MLKKILPILPLFIFVVLLNSCGTNTEIVEKQKIDSAKTNTNEIISQLLEQARQDYLSALEKLKNHNTAEVIQHFESALNTISELSYYPGIENNEAFNELENSIVEDYKGFLDKLDKIPPDVSISALDEWMSKSVPEIKLTTKKTTVNRKKFEPSGYNSDISLEINPIVQQWLDYFQNRGSAVIKRWFERSGKYFPMMEKVFREENVPRQLLYLSMVESGLNPRARSWARAVGMWQFIRGTGRLYGLKSDFYVDDRRNPELSTRAAAKHLKELYNELGDWYLAIASYNSGIGWVNRAKSRSGGNDFWSIRWFLPRETRNYVPQYIAVAIIATNPAKYGIKDLVYEKPFHFDKFLVKGAIDMRYLASIAGTSLKTLRDMNPELTQLSTPTAKRGGYYLKIPKGSLRRFAKGMQNVPKSARVYFLFHIIRRGETLSGIAYRYRISISKLAEANNLSRRSRIYVGKKLKIPVLNVLKQNYAYNPDVVAAVDANSHFYKDSKINNQDVEADDLTKINRNYIVPNGFVSVDYTVKREDSLIGIADLFGARVSDIRNWNNIPYTSSFIIGQKLKIYVPKEKKKYFTKLNESSKDTLFTAIPIVKRSKGRWQYHRIRYGESLSTIAENFGVRLRDLKRWNGLRSSRIYVGKRLRIYGFNRSYVRKSVRKKVAAKNIRPKGKYTFYKVKNGDTISELSEKFNVSVRQIQYWNNLRTSRIVAGKNLKIYKGKKYIVSKKIQPAKQKPEDKNVIYYTVHDGDAISLISEKFAVSNSDIRKWNGLRSNKIRAGKKLKIVLTPEKNIAEINKKKIKRDKTKKEKPKKGIYVLVKRGDTISQIAEKYNVSTKEIRGWNNLKRNKIIAGKNLNIIPRPKTEKKVTKNSNKVVEDAKSRKTYIVGNGESLWTIAKEFNTSIKKLKEINSLSTNKLIVGQELIVE
ncbi:MAG TPA: LysM peptidoglycan-binding domain-containing protein [Ignavibacteria bacterium]|nr:LysM peptidoglycan-binding domain-containing protein [Ignavibacteria bacterium]